ncbi:hypothetical protein PCCS19_21310 [Paenibacillus sp. CCS19]|uniref:hypothetical protein n=1 Tax=Paenibacillus sp. CCS19 TaxID=3158387 RepID=UPI00255E489A|nr:hypothetical protein [Paenibacillus cellulosilyticus]GMK39077.1 hypothetical protein PCCS19_21310 [Paenibacillus cellulosilyticus]
MKFLMDLRRHHNRYIQVCFERGKGFASPHEEELARQKIDAMDLILAFMLSAIDRKYPFMKKGFRDSLPEHSRNAVIAFCSEIEDHNYPRALMRAASKLGMPVGKLKVILDEVDAQMKSLAYDQVKGLIKDRTDVEVKFTMHFFWQKVQMFESRSLV